LEYSGAKTVSQRNGLALESFLAPLEIKRFGTVAVWHYGEVRIALEKRVQPIGSMGTLIAAHALALGTTLVTNSQAEFARVEGL